MVYFSVDIWIFWLKTEKCWFANAAMMPHGNCSSSTLLSHSPLWTPGQTIFHEAPWPPLLERGSGALWESWAMVHHETYNVAAEPSQYRKMRT